MIKTILSGFFLLAGLSSINAQIRSVAFFYGINPPIEELSKYQIVVLQPGAINQELLKAFHDKECKVYCYFSIGEVAKSATYYNEVEAYTIGDNPHWNSKIFNLAHPKVKNYILNKLIKPYIDMGIDGMFFDTLDSYMMLTKNENAQKKQQKALANIIKSCKKKFRHRGIILNRGFEVIDDVAKYVDAVAFESLFVAYHGTNGYVAVKPEDREWLTQILNNIKKKHKLPIISIDYLPSKNWGDVDILVEAIKQQGYIPWITNKNLTRVGKGIEK